MGLDLGCRREMEERQDLGFFFLAPFFFKSKTFLFAERDRRIEVQGDGTAEIFLELVLKGTPGILV